VPQGVGDQLGCDEEHALLHVFVDFRPGRHVLVDRVPDGGDR
jgi:hypothetical protein